MTSSANQNEFEVDGKAWHGKSDRGSSPLLADFGHSRSKFGMGWFLLAPFYPVLRRTVADVLERLLELPSLVCKK